MTGLSTIFIFFIVIIFRIDWLQPLDGIINGYLMMLMFKFNDKYYYKTFGCIQRLIWRDLKGNKDIKYLTQTVVN